METLLPPFFWPTTGEFRMTDDPFSFDLENHDEDFIFMPDEVMSLAKAAAREKEIEISDMIKLIIV